MKTLADTPELLVLEKSSPGLGAALGGMFVFSLAIALGVLIWGTFLAGLAMLGFALLPLILFGFLVARLRASFERATGMLRTERRALFGTRTSETPLAAITRAGTRVVSGTNPGATGHSTTTAQTHLVVLHLADGGDEPLATNFSTARAAQDVADQINAWLDASGATG